MILVEFRACGHALEIPPRDVKEETERAAAGQPCPRCRAALDNPLPRPRDRRALTSAANGKRGGRPRTVQDTRIYSLAVPAGLREWLRQRGPDEVREALERWRAETFIV